MVMSVLTQELLLGSLQSIRLYQEFAARAAEGTMSDEEIMVEWDQLEGTKQDVRDKIARRKAELQAQESDPDQDIQI